MTLQVLKQKQHPQLFGKFGDSAVIFPTLIYIAFITTGHFLSLGGIRLDGAISPLNELEGCWSSGIVSGNVEMQRQIGYVPKDFCRDRRPPNVMITKCFIISITRNLPSSCFSQRVKPSRLVHLLLFCEAC